MGSNYWEILFLNVCRGINNIEFHKAVRGFHEEIEMSEKVIKKMEELVKTSREMSEEINGELNKKHLEFLAVFLRRNLMNVKKGGIMVWRDCQEKEGERKAARNWRRSYRSSNLTGIQLNHTEI